jgi:hypothetical protein
LEEKIPIRGEDDPLIRPEKLGQMAERISAEISNTVWPSFPLLING